MAFACAHRGLSAELPENSIAAFQAAVDAGFDALEMDLRATSDGEVVILHDPALERTTSGSGRVRDITYAELLHHGTAAGPVPRLDDLFRQLSGWGGLWNLELKSRYAAAHTLELVAHHGLQGRAIITSIEPGILAAARQMAPDQARGLVVLGEVDDVDIDTARELDCAWLNPDHEWLSAKQVQKMHEAGLRVGAWTVNDPARALKLAEWGVECIITDERLVHHALKAARPAAA